MISVVGMAGDAVPTSSRPVLDAATLVVGGERHLRAAGVRDDVRTIVLGNLSSALDALAAYDGPAAVLASGDPGFFGVLRALRERGLPVGPVLPAVSSVAAAFAAAALPWDDATVVSAHGRDHRVAVNACRALDKVAVLTEPGFGPAELGRALAGSDRTLVVAERLGTSGERVVRCRPEEAGAGEWLDPNVVLVIAPDAPTLCRAVAGPPGAPAGWALLESEFAHRDGMVTKAEVRALALAHLAPRVGTLVWDVGAGSGSVAVECARFGAAVLAVERDAEQLARVRDNAARHRVTVQTIAGSAPEALAPLPDPDAVFVGGGGPPVLEAVLARRPARVVTALAALDRVPPAREALRRSGYAIDGSLLQANRLVDLPDGGLRLAATNPVVLVWGELP